MRTTGIFVLVLFLLAACTDRGGTPRNIIPKDSMASVLWDIIQADQFSTYYLTKDSAKDIKKETMKLYGAVFDLHHVSRDEFQKSLEFYYSRPDLNREIFDSLAARGNRKRGEMYKSVPKKPDSTKNLRGAGTHPDSTHGKHPVIVPAVKKADSIKNLNLPKAAPARNTGHQPTDLFKQPGAAGKPGRQVFPTERGGDRKPGNLFKPDSSKKVLIR